MQLRLPVAYANADDARHGLAELWAYAAVRKSLPDDDAETIVRSLIGHASPRSSITPIPPGVAVPFPSRVVPLPSPDNLPSWTPPPGGWTESAPLTTHVITQSVVTARFHAARLSTVGADPDARERVARSARDESERLLSYADATERLISKSSRPWLEVLRLTLPPANAPIPTQPARLR